ncbi:MAG TPA: C25 family peptidase propeptide domain-containing protein [Candidatus Cloacimonadota bacterium]|nr:C25 family peptidase propeptide domain-containing protein [Candidatus Cloacimonadota bacterium]
MKQTLSLIIVLWLGLSLAPARIRVLESNPSQLLLEYTIDDYKLLREGEFQALTSSDMSSFSLPGSPDLPYSELKIGIPPGAGISAQIISSSKVKQPLSHRLRPVPHMEERDGISFSNYLINESDYRNALRPTIEMLPETGFRGYSFVPVTVHPFTYDGDLGLEITTQALIRVIINGNTGYRGQTENDPLAEIVLEQLVNKDFAVNWPSQTRAPSLPACAR